MAEYGPSYMETMIKYHNYAQALERALRSYRRMHGRWRFRIVETIVFDENIERWLKLFEANYDRVAVVTDLANKLRTGLQERFYGKLWDKQTEAELKHWLSQMLAEFRQVTDLPEMDLHGYYDSDTGQVVIHSEPLAEYLREWFKDMLDVPNADTYEGLSAPEPGIYFNSDRTQMVAVIGTARREKYRQHNMVLYQDVNTEELVYVPLMEWHSHQKWTKFDG